MANKLVVKTKDFFWRILRKKSVQNSLIPIALALLFVIVVWSNTYFGNGKLATWLLDNLNIAIPIILMIFFFAIGIPHNNSVGPEAARWRLFIWFMFIAGALWIVINGSERHMEGSERLKWEQKVADLNRQIDLLKATSIPQSASDSILTMKNHAISEKNNRIIRLQDSLKIALNHKCPECPETAATVDLDSAKRAWTDEYVKSHPAPSTPSNATVDKKDMKQDVVQRTPNRSSNVRSSTKRTQTGCGSTDGYVPRRVYEDGYPKSTKNPSVDRTQDQ